MKTTIDVNKTNIQTLGTKYHRFYVVGCSRPVSKKIAKEGLKIGAKIVAVERNWEGNKKEDDIHERNYEIC